MRIEVTLRYVAGNPVTKKTTEDVPPGCTAGELCAALIRAEEEENGISFDGANVVTLVNGLVVISGHVLHDSDEVKVMPVAAGG